ncbi:MAG: ABC transporter permease [Christensenellaceae bacterium]
MTKTKPHFSRKLLAIPYGLFLFLFVLIPLLIIVYYAFTDGNGSFTLKNFREFFSSNGEGLIGFFTSSTARESGSLYFDSQYFARLFIAYPVAYIIANCRLKTKSVLLLLFVVPMWINFVLRINALRELLDWIGIYNKSEWNMFNTILGMVYDFLPFMVLPIYTTLIKIDNSYLEAARDLGATGAKTFMKVTLPLSKSGIVSGCTMVFLPSMSNYVVSKWMTNGKITIIGSFIEQYFFSRLGYGW